MTNLIAFRKLHRKIAPLIFLPLILAAITGILYSLATNWLGIDESAAHILMKIHKGQYLGYQLSSAYVILLGLGSIGMIVTGLTMIKLFPSKRPQRPGAKLDFRRIHRLVAPVFFLPLTISTITGVAYQVGHSLLRIDDEKVEIFMIIHQGEYLGDFLKVVYVLLVGLGAIALLITGLDMTGIFRKPRQTNPPTHHDSES